MPKKLKFIIFIVLWCFNFSFSQETSPVAQNISKKISDYYFYDRETIHLHLNKNQYFSSEEIWFKGYIYNRKSKLPFVETNNVYVLLLDENGNKIQTNLFFADQGVFSGSLKLKETIASGRYFIQTYTNWMNNFYENESSVFAFDVINTKDTEYIPSTTVRETDLKTVFTPESGVFLNGFTTAIGIHIFDCFSNGVQINSGEIIDSEGEIVTTFATDKSGYGKFEIKQSTNLPLKAVYNFKGRTFSETLPNYAYQGVSIAVNNTTFNDKTILVIRKKLNEKTTTDVFYLVIYQNEKSIVHEFSFGSKNEITFTIPKSELFVGLNTTLILDNTLKKLCERLLFNPYSNKVEINFSKTSKTAIDVTFKGTISQELGDLSISVLPEESLNLDNKKNIFASFQTDAMTENVVNILPINFTSKDRINLITIDNALINKKNKTNWDFVINNTQRSSFEFDKGLTIKGTINQDLKDFSKYQVELFSLPYNLNIKSPLSDKKEFVFENLALADSLMLNLTLYKDLTKTVDIKMYYTVSNANRVFSKPFKPESIVCSKPIKQETDIAKNSMPLFKEKIIYLDNVDVSGNSKNNFKRLNTNTNSSNYKAFKIAGTEKEKLLRITDFLSQQGFAVVNDFGQLNIYSRIGNREQKSPAIYVDDILLLEYSILESYDMSQIDEIYIDMYSDSFIQGNANQGVIKIYTLPGSKIKSNYSETKAIIVKGGFTKNTTFKNKEYYTYDDLGFKNHGVIHWEPLINVTNGNFELKFPHYNQKVVKLKIEGMTKNGELISEIITLNL